MAAAHPFDFYQTSERGGIGSGIVSAYSGQFSGFFTPTGLFNTPGGYIFGIEDNVYTPAQIIINESGDFSSTNPDSVGINGIFSGTFYPVSQESGSTSCSFSGKLSGDNLDYHNIYSIITGEVKSDGIDNPNYQLKFTGEFPRPWIDITPITNIISGELTPQFYDSPKINLIISGNFLKYERDNDIIGFSFETISWTRGSLQVKETGNDTSFVSFSMEYIGWSQLN